MPGKFTWPWPSYLRCWFSGEVSHCIFSTRRPACRDLIRLPVRKVRHHLITQATTCHCLRRQILPIRPFHTIISQASSTRMSPVWKHTKMFAMGWGFIFRGARNHCFPLTAKKNTLDVVSPRFPLIGLPTAKHHFRGQTEWRLSCPNCMQLPGHM